MAGFNTKKCLICKRSNDTLHWHADPETSDIWVWCTGKCQRGYSLWNYCHQAGVSVTDFLKNDISFAKEMPNEVQRMDFPHDYLTISDPRSNAGVSYIKSRGLSLQGDIYYDAQKNGIVFPYYFENHFVGAQTRLIDPKTNRDGVIQKMDTIPGTRLGLLFYNWNQTTFMTNVKMIIVTEGAFNALSIQQSLTKIYGGIVKNPFRCVAASGSGASQHQQEKMKEMVAAGYKVIIAPDSDEAGLKMLSKFNESMALTHFALPDDGKDWNDHLQEIGHDAFAKLFLSRVKGVQ